MAKTKQPLKIPFRNGNLLHYVDWYHGEPEWRDNYEFDATVEYVDYSRGRSSVVVDVKENGTGFVHGMSLMDFMSIVKELEEGYYTGRFTFKKQGPNYFLTLVKA